MHVCHNGDNQSSTIRIIRIIFLESYARILTYETLSYVNHIVAWYFRPMQGSSSLDFNHETSTQNRSSFAKSDTPLLPVYLKQIFFEFLSKDCYLFYAVCWLLPTLFGSATPPSGTSDASYSESLPYGPYGHCPCADLCNNTRIMRVFYIFNNTHVF